MIYCFWLPYEEQARARMEVPRPLRRQTTAVMQARDDGILA